MNKTKTTKEIQRIKKWFEENPRRKICHINYGGVYCKIRRTNLLKDIQEIGVVGNVK